MKNFLLKSFSFTSLLFALLFGICSIPFSDDFISYKTKETAYHKVASNIELIRKNPHFFNKKTLFFGPSLMQGGVNDSILTANGISSYNMSTPHNGFEVNYYFLNRLRHLGIQPKAVILIQPKTPFKSFHKLTPLLYEPVNLYDAGQGLNLSFVKYLGKRTKLVFEFLKFKLKNKEQNYSLGETKGSSIKYGAVFYTDEISKTEFNANLRDLIKRDEYLNLYLNNFLYISEKRNIVNQLKSKIRLVKHKLSKLDFFYNSTSQQRFRNKIKSTCKEQDINFITLYVPRLIDTEHYNDYIRSPFYLDNFSKSNSSLIIHKSTYKFLNANEYWSDIDHLNKSGAEIFTKEILNMLSNHN